MTVQTYSVTEDGKAIHCGLCGRTSHNPNDAAFRYCGACHVFHEDLARAIDGLVDAATAGDLQAIQRAEVRLLGYIRGAVQAGRGAGGL